MRHTPSWRTKSIINDAIEINKNLIATFTGGEPTLNNDTFILAEYCKKRSIKTMLLTNGTLIDENNADTIARNFDSIRISIEGSSEEIHDTIRGKGSLKQALKGVNLLKKAGNEPFIAMTINKINMHDVINMVKIYGNRLHFQPIYNVGRAKHSDIGIEGEEYFNIMNNIDGVRPYAFLQEHLIKMKNRGCTKCAIGEGEISVSCNGDVFPCHMLHVDKFYCGNIKNQSFNSIYRRSETLKMIRSMSVYSGRGCKECPVKPLCAGGCWARSYFENGDLNVNDSFCDYELLSFKKGLFDY
ncbi:MAG: radical SAM protein [Desulfovibrionaceae bacterium]|nr:radical SAM protein [Desulfovibrionaceae bacterium]